MNLWYNKKMKTAYIGATMDLPHYGHQELINKAKEIADYVFVILNTDEFVQEFKGKKPIMTLEERLRTVMGFKNVFDVGVNIGGADSKPAILTINPDYIVFGDDYDLERYKKQIGVTDEWLKEHHIELKQFPYTKSISTTELKKRIKEQ